MSLQGGEVSRIDVPAGSNLTLTATASKDLASVEIVPHRLQKAGMPITGAAPKMLDPRTFSMRFDNIRFEQNFLFRFVDTDGVTGQRQIVIIPSEDAPPKIREFAPDKIVRKVQGGYMATITARIPFLAEVDDDHGLNEVRYAYTISSSGDGPAQSPRRLAAARRRQHDARLSRTTARIDRSGLSAPAVGADRT